MSLDQYKSLDLLLKLSAFIALIFFFGVNYQVLNQNTRDIEKLKPRVQALELKMAMGK